MATVGGGAIASNLPLPMERAVTGGFKKSLQRPALIVADFCNKICH
jgi:hypothetical protein